MFRLESVVGETALHIAASRGNDEEVARLLAEDPASIFRVTDEGVTPLHRAAQTGSEKVVERLLAASPVALTNAVDRFGKTALYYAAEIGHVGVVSQLQSRTVIDSDHRSGSTVLHVAASKGYGDLVIHLLNVSPILIDKVDWCGKTALCDAAMKGHELIVAHMLSLSPTLIDNVDRFGRTVLHYASGSGHDAVVAQLLTARPALVDSADRRGRTALHWAVREGRELIAERLLAIKPDLIHAIDEEGHTPLHLAVAMKQAQGPLIERLWGLYPEALRVTNKSRESPLHAAILTHNDVAIDIFQWHLTFDEIVQIFVSCDESHTERLRPVMEKECECLLAWLNQDVVGSLFEYLGFECVKRSHKRARLGS